VILAAAISAARAEEVRVERVFDGDSIVLADGREVRYLGINAPEAGETFSTAARALNRRLVEGKRVRLVPDREPRDAYGRVLAYVYVDGTFVNAEILRAGLAHLFLFGPLREEEALLAREREARSARRGIWGTPTLAGPLRITAPRGHPRRGASRAVHAVTICNVSGHAVDLEGFALRVDGGRAGGFRFPRARLGPAHVVVVVRSAGRDRRDGSRALRFHWGPVASDPPAPARLTLVGPTGAVVDEVRLEAAPAAATPRGKRREGRQTWGHGPGAPAGSVYTGPPCAA
jgi:endonuclease YncB( thermonuclease family)